MNLIEHRNHRVRLCAHSALIDLDKLEDLHMYNAVSYNRLGPYPNRPQKPSQLEKIAIAYLPSRHGPVLILYVDLE